MADGVVQVAPDATGKKIDTAELTRADATVVERQRIAVGDGDDAQQATANVRGPTDRAGLLVISDDLAALQSIDRTLSEIKVLLTMALMG